MEHHGKHNHNGTGANNGNGASGNFHKEQQRLEQLEKDSERRLSDALKIAERVRRQLESGPGHSRSA